MNTTLLPVKPNPWWHISFRRALLLALLLHVLGIVWYAWNHVSQEIVLPFRELNIKIGSPQAAPSPFTHKKDTPPPAPRATSAAKPVPAPQPAPAAPVIQPPRSNPQPTRKPVHTAVPKLPAPQQPISLRPAARPSPPVPYSTPPTPQRRPQAMATPTYTQPAPPMPYDPAPAAPVRQHQSTQQAYAPSAHGSTFGNRSKAFKEYHTQYTELLSGWVYRHKSPEPQRAEGRGIVRLKIDRYGNILSYELVRRTGNAALDQAIMDMVERSNPVPPFPKEWGEYEMDFLLPMAFEFE